MTWYLVNLNCPYCLNAVLAQQTSLLWKDDCVLEWENEEPVEYQLRKWKTIITCGGCNKTIAKSYQYIISYWVEPTEEQKRRIEEPLGLIEC